MFRIFFIHLSVDRHLGCFHVLAIVPSAGMNIGVHVCFWIIAFSGYMSRRGATAGLIQLLWKTLWMFLQDLKIDQPYGPLLMKRKETLLWNSTERAFIFPMSHYASKSFSNFPLSFCIVTKTIILQHVTGHEENDWRTEIISPEDRKPEEWLKF